MRRFLVLDSFRGLFALLVVLYHLRLNTFITSNMFIVNCDLFVDFFFVLSGFVVCAAYLNKLDSFHGGLNFIKKRFRRLYPLYIYTLVVFIFFEFGKYFLFKMGIFNHPAFKSNDVMGLINYISLLNSTPIIQNRLSWNYPGWSISAEFIAYLAFAITFVSFKRWRLVILVTLLTIYILIFYLKFGNLNATRVSDFGYLRGLLSFTIGNITYFIFLKISHKTYSKYMYTIAEFLIVSLIIISVINYPFLQWVSLIYAIQFSICILIFCAEKGMISSFLKGRYFQALGKYSYSIYLNQAIVIAIAEDLFVKPNSSPLFLFMIPFIVIAIIITYSHYTFKFIENRFYKVKHEVPSVKKT